MKSPLKWPGGKGPLASWIVSLMPEHLHYVEPYFGAGSVLFAKDPWDTSEVVNDLNGDLMNFWLHLQDGSSFDLMQRALEATPFGQPVFVRAYNQIKPHSDWPLTPLERAIAFFVHVRQSLAGRGKCFTALSRTRTRRGMNEQVSSWLTAVEGLPEVHARLKRVVILNRPALDVIRSEDGPQTLFYLDPPYLPSTRHKGGGEYGEHEMTFEDHAALLNTIRDTQGRVMLSGYHSAMYDSCLSHWKCHEKVVANHASHSRTKGKEVECLWVNF